MANIPNAIKAAALSVAVVLLSGGCMSSNVAVQADAQAQPATPVEVQQLGRTSIHNELTYIGQVEAKKTVNVISKLAAEVKEVHFDIGDTVQEGDILFTVDAKDIEDQITLLEVTKMAQEIGMESALYSYEIATGESAQEKLSELQTEMNVSNARYGTLSADTVYDASKDSVEALESQLEMAEKTAAEARALLGAMQKPTPPPRPDPSLGSSGEWEQYEREYTEYERELATYNALLGVVGAPDEIRRALEQAEVQKSASRYTYNQADRAWDIAADIYDVSKLVTAESKERASRQANFGVRSAQAQMYATEVQLAIAQYNAGHAVVRSPLSGVISGRNIESGQMISQQSVPFTVISMDTVNVAVGVSETLINSIHVGDGVEVTIQALGNSPIKGVVTAVSPAAGMTGTYPVRIELDNSGGLIKPGMFAQVKFVKEKAENTLVVPKHVVLSDETNQYVYVVRGGVAVRVNVETGISGGQDIEILGGIAEDDQIVVLGQEYLHDGMSVNVIAVDGQRVRVEAGQEETKQDSGETEHSSPNT